MNANLEYLKKLAHVATPGPWETDATEQNPHANAVRYAGGQIQGGANICGIAVLHDGGQDRESMDANGAFIAECNPETVLCLIDEIERLQAEIERMHDAFEDFKEYVQAGGTEYD